MQSWLARLRRRLQPVLSLRSETPRLPVDALEAERVFQRWDALNGRYYFKADVILEEGSLLRDVAFDGDTNVAVEHARRPLHLQPGLLGRSVTAWLVTDDRTAGTRYGSATPEQREAFARNHGVRTERSGTVVEEG